MMLYLGDGSPRSKTSTASWFGDVQNSYANAQLVLIMFQQEIAAISKLTLEDR
jgi:hypothetical protein